MFSYIMGNINTEVIILEKQNSVLFSSPFSYLLNTWAPLSNVDVYIQVSSSYFQQSCPSPISFIVPGSMDKTAIV